MVKEVSFVKGGSNVQPYREQVEEKFSPADMMVFLNYKKGPGEMVGEHWHPSFELLYMFGGHARQVLEERELVLHPGDTLLIAPGATHATYSLEEDCYIGVVSFFSKFPLPSIYLPENDFPLAPSLFSRLQEEKVLQRAGSDWISQGILWECLGYLYRQGEKLPRMVSATKQEMDLEDYLRAHLAEVSLQSAADYMGYAPTYFSKWFQKKMGMSFKRYLDISKMQAAKGLLADGVSTSETAAVLGYDTPASFCRAFKRLTGSTPSSGKPGNRKTDMEKSG